MHSMLNCYTHCRAFAFQDSEEPKIDEENKAEAEARNLFLNIVRIAVAAVSFSERVPRLLLLLFHQAPEKKEEKKVHNLSEQIRLRIITKAS